MKKLPIGISGLAEMVTNDDLYVGKTKPVCHLTENGKYYFLSHPRCFGKSLMNVSVLF